MSSQPIPSLQTVGGSRVPGFHTPEPAAIALSHAAHYAAWRPHQVDDPPSLPDIQKDEAGVLLASALRRDGGWLTPDEVRRLLGLYGVSMVDQRQVGTADDAGEAAEQLGGEVALKAIARGLLHKSDIGGVRLHLTGRQAVTADEMTAAVRGATGMEPTGFVVQRMVPAGVEMLVGVVNDRQFGPTIDCGAGGTLVEVLKDVSVRLSPLTRRDATSMLRELRSFPVLEGYRGAMSMRSRTYCCASGHWLKITRKSRSWTVTLWWSVRLERLSWTRVCELRPHPRDVRSVRDAELNPPSPQSLSSARGRAALRHPGLQRGSEDGLRLFHAARRARAEVVRGLRDQLQPIHLFEQRSHFRLSGREW